MAENIGPKIGLEGEKEFKTALNSAVQQLNTMKSSVAALDSEFKAGNISQEEYKRQSEDLKKKIGDQRAKVKELKDGLSEMSEKYGENDSKVLKWRKQLEDATIKLNSMDGALKDTSSDTDELSEQMDDAAKSTSDWTDVLKGNLLSDAVKAGFKALKNAAKETINTFKDAAVEGAAYADNIKTLSDETGVSAQKLQELQYATELVDVSVDTVTKSMQKNIKSMASAADESKEYANAYKQLGIDVTNADGSLRDSEAVYWELIDALGKIDNETERDATAMRLLGKNAQELNPLIKAGSDRMAELAREAHNAGYVMSDEMLESYGELDDELQRLKNSTTAAKNALGTVFIPTLKSLAGDGTRLLNKFSRGVNDANGDVRAVGHLIGSMAPDVAKAGKKVIKEAGKIVEGIFEELTTPESFKSMARAGGDLIEGIFKGAINVAGHVVYGFVELVSDAVSSIGDETEKGYKEFAKLTDEQQELIDTMHESFEEFEASKNTFNDVALSIEEESRQTEKLWQELQTLTDENGNVTDANKDRVDYILGELNSALGTEYERNGDIIDQYQDMQQELDKLIEKRKAERYAEGYDDLYKNAIQGIKDWEEKNYSMRNGIKEDEEEVARLEGEVERLSKAVADGAGNAQVLNDRMALSTAQAELKTARGNLEQLTEEYEEGAAEAAGYYATIAAYDEGLNALYEGSYENAVKIFANQTSARWRYHKDGQKLTATELKQLEEDYNKKLAYFEYYKEEYERGNKAFTASGLKEARDAADELEKILKDASKDAETYGGYVGEGFAKGIVKQIEQVKRASKELADTATLTIKNTARIASPSKITTEYGEFVTIGLGNGIKNEAKYAEQAARDMMRGVLDQTSTEAIYNNMTVSPYQSNTTTSSSSVSIGDVTVVVDGAGETDPDILAERVAERLCNDLVDRRAVYR